MAAMNEAMCGAAASAAGNLYTIDPAIEPSTLWPSLAQRRAPASTPASGSGPWGSRHAGDLTASTSTSIVISLDTTRPPASRTMFHVTPQSSGLIRPVAPKTERSLPTDRVAGPMGVDGPGDRVTSLIVSP